VKAVILALFLLVLAAPAAAQEPLRLEPYRDGIGYLGLRVTGPAGATVTVGETTGGTAAPLGQVALATGAPGVLAFSLFTNDDPPNVSALETAVRTSLDRAGPNGCAVWATIVRPPLNGVSYAAANRRLNQLAADPALRGRLRVVPWAAAVRANPGWLAGDGVHATPDGYRASAQMYADAARSCDA
jgi:lysophospholipase L1-like esterase